MGIYRIQSEEEPRSSRYHRQLVLQGQQFWYEYICGNGRSKYFLEGTFAKEEDQLVFTPTAGNHREWHDIYGFYNKKITLEAIGMTAIVQEEAVRLMFDGNPYKLPKVKKRIQREYYE